MQQISSFRQVWLIIDATGVLIIDATDPTPIPPAHKWLPIMLTNRNSALGVTDNGANAFGVTSNGVTILGAV